MDTQPTRLDTADYQVDSATRDRNCDRHTDQHIDECWRCGRGLTEKAQTNARWVHMTTDNELAPTSEDPINDQESQGYFPLGPECAKHIPTTHRHRLSTPTGGTP